MQYNEKKAAQAAAFFISRAQGELQILKLMKLLYLAERKSFEVYGEPMIGDKLVSMDHGPVLSRTLDHMNKFIPSAEGGWETWISDRADHNLRLKVEIKEPRSELSQLSESEVEILESIWNEFGHMRAFDLAELTHKICPEWEDPKGTAIPIPHIRLLKFLYRADVAEELEKRFDCQREIDSIFARKV